MFIQRKSQTTDRATTGFWATLVLDIPRSLLFAGLAASIFVLTSPDFDVLFNALSQSLPQLQGSEQAVPLMGMLAIHFVLTSAFFLPFFLLAPPMISKIWLPGIVRKNVA